MFLLPKLPYQYNALEPAIDAKTVEIHYTKHHQTYYDKLNAGLAGTEYENWELEKLLSEVNSLPDNLKPIVKNHGGGLYNHTIYWETMVAGGSTPSDYITSIIEKAFGSWEGFETEFKTKATTLFGSGWTRLEMTNDKLQITNYPNQENPLMYGKIPVLGCDVREHAYYLKRQNRRPEYIDARWSIINRDSVEKIIKH